jgi:branched-chain amino acid transport system ATP-binding protein
MTEPVLAVEGLVKAFGAVRATDGVSLDLKPGEIHALIGPNGAGKSTLIRLVSGALRPDAGRVRFIGRDVSRLDVAGRARLGLGRTFQVSSLLPEGSAMANVLVAVQARTGSSLRFFRRAMSDRAAADEAMERLAEVGLADRAAIPSASLSHGERRLLEVAVALALRPKALLLDEPMAGMGPEGSRAFTVLLDRLRERAPILLVEHDMDAVFALADRVSVLVYGRLIATGTVEEIRRDPGVREAYLGGGEP